MEASIKIIEQIKQDCEPLEHALDEIKGLKNQLDLSDFKWTCKFCDKMKQGPYILAEVSFKKSSMFIPGNKFKIVNLFNDGLLVTTCPRCFSFNFSTGNKKVNHFMKLYSNKSQFTINDSVHINCNSPIGCGQMQLARLMPTEDGEIVFSIAGENGKNTLLNKSQLTMACPRCNEKSVANKHNVFNKFFRGLIPEMLLAEFDKEFRDSRKIVIGDSTDTHEE